jgi:DNA modification methylase
VIESPLLVGFVGKDEQTGHPAQKPIAVYDRLIRMTTAKGDTIFDPMCGSGTTGVVAFIRDRHAIQSDANPEYLQIAQRRLDRDYTGWAEHLDEIGNNRDKPPPKANSRRGRKPLNAKDHNRQDALPV